MVCLIARGTDCGTTYMLILSRTSRSKVNALQRSLSAGVASAVSVPVEANATEQQKRAHKDQRWNVLCGHELKMFRHVLDQLCVNGRQIF